MAATCTGSIWVVRHGERADVDPEWEKTATRPHDPPLTALGHVQAAATATVLAGEAIEAIFSSPFLRCMQTAAAIARALGLQIRIEPGLSEILNASWYSSDPVDEAMSDDALAAAVGDALIDRSYVPLFDTAARRAGQHGGNGATDTVDYELLTFPEPTPLAAADRYARTLQALQRATPFALLVTHGFGVQAIAEACDDVEVLECDFCALTRLHRQAQDAPWSCDVLCRSTHIVGLTATGTAGP